LAVFWARDIECSSGIASEDAPTRPGFFVAFARSFCRFLTMEPLPPAVMDAMRPLVPALTDEIIEAVGREVPAYRRPLEGAFGEGVRRGVGVALSRFVESSGAPDRAAASVYIALGRGEYRQGRSLEALLAAYRVGARIAWRRITEAGAAAGVEPADLYRVGEALFTYIDALSAESAEGWASAQASAAGERQRRRAELVALFAEDPPPDPSRVEAAGEEAGWPLPASVVAVAVREEDVHRTGSRLGPDALAATLGGAGVIVVPAPAPSLVVTTGGAAGPAAGASRGAVGPAVPLREAARSIALARRLLRLVEEGVVSEREAPVHAEDHLPALIVHADPPLARDLAARELAPLDDLSPTARTKLLTTLRVWLDDQGRIEQTAHHLDVHPQTVRYRVNQMRELFGRRLEEPEGRFALSLALRVRPT
jgi:hypothetical protein